MIEALLNLAILASVIAGAGLFVSQCYLAGRFLFAAERVMRVLAWIVDRNPRDVEHSAE